jgi:stress response protein YsnF
MARTTVAHFASITEAERAAAALESAGISRSHIRVIDSATARQYEESAGAERRTGGGFWSWLFGDVESESERGFPEDDARYFSTRIREEGALVMVTTPDEGADRVRELLERYGARVDQRTGRTVGTTDREKVIPVVEEEVRVGKRPVERGGVRVYRHVVERPIEEHLRLREERIRVERRAVDRPLDRTVREPFREETIELTEMAEEPVIEKRARVVEEVTVSKEVEARDTAVHDKVRRTEVEVERTGGGFTAMEADFRQHCAAAHGGRDLYDHCSPAYQYGFSAASERRDLTDWATAEPDLRRGWEASHPGTWERFKDSIRYAWERVRGRARAA